MPFAPLVTARLRLEPITDEMAVAIVSGEPTGLSQGKGWPHEHTIDGLSMAVRNGQPAGWFVVLDGDIIGDCGTHGPADEEQSVEIGYGLAHDFRRQGFGTEVVEVISRWLLSLPEIDALKARTTADNVGSQRVLEKAGFHHIATARDHLTFDRRSS